MFSPQSVGALERNLRNLPIQIDPFLLNSSSMDQKKKTRLGASFDSID